MMERIRQDIIFATMIMLSIICFASFPLLANNNYSIYIDADFTSTKTSSLSIKQGIETALAEVNNKVQGYTFDIVIKDHRGNSRRSSKNLQTYLQDNNALLVFSGLHSPPLLANKSFINNNKILVLDPWAAAGPITRSADKENWIFRLSIDDSNAGSFISEQAYATGFRKPYLLLEDTGWGLSNKKTMTKALAKRDIKPQGVAMFNWGIGINHAKLMLRTIAQSGADVIFLVANSQEGKTFAHAMIELSAEFSIPVRSHWGITGGDFAQSFNESDRELLNLQFIQTRFSFLQEPLSEIGSKVLSTAIKHLPEVSSKYDIKAQTGFVHSYDLTKILIAAINQAGLTGNKEQDLIAIHQALEQLLVPVQGLLKRYQQPFSKYSATNKNAHEALTPLDYAMGRYNKHNQVLLIETYKNE